MAGVMEVDPPRRSPFFKRIPDDQPDDDQAAADEADIYGYSQDQDDDDGMLAELLSENPPEAPAQRVEATAKPAAKAQPAAPVQRPPRQKAAAPTPAAKRHQPKRPAQVRDGNPVGDAWRTLRRIFPDWRQLSAAAPPALMALVLLPLLDVQTGRGGWMGISIVWGLALYMHYRPIYRVAPRQDGVFEKLAPQWAINAADRVAREGSAFRLVLSVLAIVLAVIGAGGLAFGGYTSIQGVRLALNALGVTIDTRSFPGLWWWVLPLACTYVQVVAKHNDSLVLLWGGSVVLDGSTTAIFAAIGFGAIVAQYAIVATNPLIAAYSAHVGLAVAVLTEHVAISAVVIGKAAIMGRSYIA